MKRFSFLFLISSCFLFCTNNASKNELNTLTEQEKQEGWELLFDGKTLNQWHTYGKNTIGKAWQIKDNSIFLDTSEKKDWQIKDGGDIVSQNEYENFHLKIEWKIAPNGNSGIIFYVKEDTTKYNYVWKTGPEMQVLDNQGHPDSKIIKHRAGDLYDLITSSPESVHPAGEWNKAEIISNKGTLQFFLNGAKVVETQLWNNDWKKMIEGSKFAQMADWGTFKKGKIALQDHGNSVFYRNIKIKKLSE